MQSYKWIHTRSNNFALKLANETPPINFVLLVPVYKEQKNIKKLIDHFSKLNFNRNYKVIFVVSELEECTDKCNKTTLEYIKKYLEEYNRNNKDGKFSYISYPNKNGSKAKKLNYALDRLKKDNECQENTYIGVYDADSRPDLNTLLSIETAAVDAFRSNGQYPIAFQQPSYFTKNINDLGIYLKLEAIFQTRWCFGHEIRTQRLSEKRSKYKIPYAYCVGHGMFIQYDFLINNYGFPEPIEDVPMGIRLDLMNIPIVSIWLFDYAEVVTSVKTLILQSGKWAKNAFLVFREVKRMHTLDVKINPYREFVILMKGLVDVFSWLHYLLCFVTSIILSIHFSRLIFICIFIIAALIDSGIGILMMATILRNKIWEKELNAFQYFLRMGKYFFIAPLRGIVRGLAPFLALFYFWQDIYHGRGNRYEGVKTTRAK